MNVLLYVFEYALLIYTGFRSYDFMRTNLAGTGFEQEGALLALFALDIGLILWHWYYRKGAKTRYQGEIAKWMIVVCFIGAFGAGTADMILRQTFVDGYQVPYLLGMFLLFGIPAIVGGNVAAVIIIQSADPEEKRVRLERFIEHRSVELALEDLESKVDALAAEVSPEIAKVIRRTVKGRAAGKFLGAVKGDEMAAGELPTVIATKRTRSILDRLFGRPVPMAVYPVETSAPPALDKPHDTDPTTPGQ